jgi:SRSO17 transposase
MGKGVDEIRLRRYFDAVIGGELRDKRQRASFAAYALGLLGEGERKSCEPIAARAASGSTEEERVIAAARSQDRLLHFLGRGTWDDEAVRLAAARYAIEALEKVEPVTTWIVDDTGFPNQGKHSVGVQRQYSGTLGKTGNCQIGVSLSVATRTEQLPIDFELYLPKSWTEDPKRRAEARIPDDVAFVTKIELAVGMIERAKKNGIPGDIVLADSAYGMSAWFREAVRCEGMDYGVAIQCSTRVWTLDSLGRRQNEPVRVDALADSLGRSAFRRVTWRDGTKRKMSSFFCFRRVKVEQQDGQTTAEREPIWLVMEWPEGEASAAKFLLTTLPRRMSKKQIVRVVKERWRTEQAYQEMKGELGLDHFEGRSFPGWHHHISVVLSCYAFVVAERRRLFPPSGAEARSHAHGRAPGTPLRGFVRHDSARDRTHHDLVAPALSDLPYAQCAQ